MLMILLKSMMFKISIITINKNNIEGLEKTINSVINQTYSDFEFIIIDGASTDRSVDLIKENNAKINFWISEPDSGIYNAMNKGILKSNGEYLLFLNSGDFLNDDSVLYDIALELKDSNVEIFSGSLWIFDKNNKTHLIQPAKEVSIYHCIHKGILHPCTFIKKTLFETYGLYNEENKYISDFEFFIKTCGLHNIEYRYTSREISCFNTLGITSQEKNIEELEIEAAKSIKKIVPEPIRKDIERLRNLEILFEQKEIKDFLKLKSKPFIFKIISKIISWI